jgi:hypothetical protein
LTQFRSTFETRCFLPPKAHGVFLGGRTPGGRQRGDAQGLAGVQLRDGMVDESRTVDSACADLPGARHRRAPASRAGTARRSGYVESI